MRASLLLLLSVELLTACGTQPTATQAPASSKAAVHKAAPSSLPVDSGTRQSRAAAAESVMPPPPPPPDSIMAFLGVRPMKYAVVSDADLRSLLFNNGLRDTLLLGRFRLINERYKQLRLYYQLTPGTGDWLETRLEPMDNSYADNCDIKLTGSVLGDDSSPVVLATMEWKNSDRGGESTRRVVNLIDVSREPRLLLRMETLSENLPFNHDDEEQRTETSCELTFALRNREIVIDALDDDCGMENLLTVPAAGRYRYQNGRVFRVGK